MTPTEVGLVLMKAALFDGRSLDSEGFAVRAWHEALEASVGLDDARQAVVDFYGDPKWGDAARRPWIMPGDVNARVRKMRSERRVSDAEAQELASRVEGLDAWRGPIRIQQLTADGLSPDAAVAKALEEASMPRLEQVSKRVQAPARRLPGNVFREVR